MLNFTLVGEPQGQLREKYLPGWISRPRQYRFVRSPARQLPTGGYINQSDGTSWMAMYSLNLMRIALELAGHNHVYEDIASKFFEHFLNIAEAMNCIVSKDCGLWGRG